MSEQRGGAEGAPANMVITEVDKHLVRTGDTVIHDGEVRTVGRGDIRRDRFMGVTLFGDSYTLGRKMVEKVAFARALPDCARLKTDTK